jgi:predicted ester cyclase
MPEQVERYRAFIDALNRQDLDAAGALVDRASYRENCVGFTPGEVGWDEAAASLRKVWQGIPDLSVALGPVAADGDRVLAHGVARGTALGRLYGAPATKRSYEASFFDVVRFAGDGLIAHRIQQADVLGQMRQLYGRPLGLAGLAALFWRLPAPDQSPATGS